MNTLLPTQFSYIVLSALGTALLTIATAYIPGLGPWFEARGAQAKRLVLLGLNVFAAAVIFGGGCAGFWQLLPCTQAGVLDVLSAIFLGMGAQAGVIQVAAAPRLEAMAERRLRSLKQ